MSDAAHLLIPFASSTAPGCEEARRSLSLPALAKLLARLAPAGVDEGDERTLSPPHERVLARGWGIDAADGCIPFAAWQVARAGGDTLGAAWAWITPCHWQVGRDHIAMTDPRELALAEPQSRQFMAAMQPYFEQDGIALEFAEPARWLARGEVFRNFPAASLDRVVGRLVDAWLPRGEHARAVRRLQQEMQMLLYTHPLNDERAAARQLPVNSFWVSGTGALPASRGAAAHAPPEVADGLREPALHDDWPAWQRAWQDIDARHCAALLSRLDRGEHVAITLCGERNARTFAGAGGGLLGKLATALRASRVRSVLESL